MEIFKISEPFIELNRLIKVLNIAESGGQANKIIDDGKVMVNGHKESRRRNKLRPGDSIIIGKMTILIEAETTAPEL